MPSAEDASAPERTQTWWLCSHLVSVSADDRGTERSPVLLEEISHTGVRLALDEPIAEGTEIEIRSGVFYARAIVAACSVRTDDCCLEARFVDDFLWTPKVWAPNHLYKPSPAKARGAAGGRE